MLASPRIMARAGVVGRTFTVSRGNRRTRRTRTTAGTKPVERAGKLSGLRTAKSNCPAPEPCPPDPFTNACFDRRFVYISNQEPIQRERTCLPALSPLGPHLRGQNEGGSTETRSYERIRDDASHGWVSVLQSLPATIPHLKMQYPPWSGMVPASVFNPSLPPPAV